eukprot:TRINITY_DN8491_c0_g1_i1.p1 TRINITY_DN8491_c0_g1~~TRINITY_DN8491_c0_g1_i1.p1  ORF type:complete len:290 (-),score=47.70 TRINITY_DN8491_c0_g1_i1:168-1037(-)
MASLEQRRQFGLTAMTLGAVAAGSVRGMISRRSTQAVTAFTSPVAAPLAAQQLRSQASPSTLIQAHQTRSASTLFSASSGMCALSACAVANVAAARRRTCAEQRCRGVKTVARAQSDISQIDFRVGNVVSCEAHPDSEKLLVEQIDVGEEEPRQICSGIAKFYSPDQLVGKKVVIVSNLKARNIGGVPSNGMVLCASTKANPDDEELSALALVEAPEGAAPGERISVEVEGEEQGEGAPPNRVAKKKLYEKVAGDLNTNAEGTVCYKNSPFMTESGPCAATSVPSGTVS